MTVEYIADLEPARRTVDPGGLSGQSLLPAKEKRNPGKTRLAA
jgi:hypothetical protein